MGWFGLRSDIIKVLNELKTDKDKCGHSEVRGQIYGSLWPDELLLGDKAEYCANGKWKSLSELMNRSQYGMEVHVIGYE